MPISRNLLILALTASFAMIPQLSFTQFLTWDYENILTDVETSGAYPDMALDSDGNLHVSFWKRGENRLSYAFRDKSTGLWDIETIPDIGNYGFRSSITVDNQGDVHIAYLLDDAGNSQLRYVSNKTGSWVVEALFSEQVIGPYGSDLLFPSHIQPSLDLFIQANGEPALMFFDGLIRGYATCSNQSFYSDYELNLKILRRQLNGTWVDFEFDPVAYTDGSSCFNGTERVGEYCQLFTRSNGQFIAIANSIHNKDLLLFESNPGSLENWSSTRLDSLERFLATFGFYEGFDFIHGSLSNDSILHLAYRSSNFYGNLPVNPAKQHMFYTQVNLNTLHDSAYQSLHYSFPTNSVPRSYLSITHHSNDDIILSYINDLSGELVVAESSDGGNNWVQDSLYAISTNADIQMDIFGDSLFLMIYDAQKDGLRLSSKKLGETDWQHQVVTLSESRGNSMSSGVKRIAGDDRIYVAYDESGRDQLYFGERVNGMWSHETVDSAGFGISSISMVIDGQNQPCIAYAFESNQTLRLSHRGGSTWTTEIIDANSIPIDIVLAAHMDSLHILYYDISEGVLSYARGQAGGQWVIQVLDSSSLIVGQRPDLTVGVDGSLHASYVDAFQSKIRYAHRSPSGIWSIEDISEAQDHSPTFNSIQVSSSGIPHVAFRDASVDSIFLAVRESDGSWTSERIVGEDVSQIGIPLKLLVDENDRPWILYNYTSFKDEMRLIRRDQQGTWHTVSVGNNQAEIANVFDFHLVDEDFYIIGKQNELGNKGLGLLYAERGVNTSIETWLEAHQVNIFPNPSDQEFNLTYTATSTEALTVEIYNLDGRLLHTILETSTLPIGTHHFSWSAHDLLPGIYLIQMKTNDMLANKKWVLRP